jgi:hypothetical protein
MMIKLMKITDDSAIFWPTLQSIFARIAKDLRSHLKTFLFVFQNLSVCIAKYFRLHLNLFATKTPLSYLMINY